VKIELVRGAEARQLCEDAAFQQAWRARVAADGKLALVQGPGFVLPWYRAYDATHEPVLVLGRSAGGEFEGLLPLARRVADGRLAHAGAEQAEYHGWLVRPGGDEEFLVPALTELRRTLGFTSWSWRWLPPGAPSGWTGARALAAAGIHVALERRPSPLWDLAQPAAIEAHDNRSLRAKRNRYRRRGEVRLERVSDPARTRALLPVLAAQCDFRQEAIHGVRPFAADPRKLEFFALRQEFPAANHFSVLWCGDEPLAFHFGGCDGRTCLLGLSSYAPHEGRNSPGTLLLVELARLLAADGYRTLDLTPGTDAYKQRLATGHQELVRVSLAGSRVRRAALQVLNRSRTALVAGAGAYDVAQAERLSRVRVGLARARARLIEGPRALFGSTPAAWGPRQRLSCFRHEPGSRGTPGPGPTVRVNGFAELQASLADRGPGERRARLAEALASFAAGDVLYTTSSGGRLARFGWRARAGSGPLPRALAAASLVASEGEVFLLSAPLLAGGGTAELVALVARMLADREATPVAGLVLCLPRPSADERRAVEALGFRAVGQADRRARLWGDASWRVRAEGGTR
jgi:CelD/BcsL family acetyltransferase involved in cellulose biosynthesis